MPLAVIIIKMQGDNDLMLRYNKYGKQFEAAGTGIPVTQVEARHFLPEEAYEVIAAKVKELMQSV